MSIWRIRPQIEKLNHPGTDSIHQSLGIEFTEVTDSSIEAKMPVDRRTHQVYGFLHGGASVVLAESVGSVASYYVGPDNMSFFGVEVGASHLKAVRTGFVRARCFLLRAGGRLLVWDIEVLDNDTPDLVSKVRLTVYGKRKDSKFSTKE